MINLITHTDRGISIMKHYNANSQAVYKGIALFIVLYFLLRLLEHHIFPLFYLQSKSLVLILLGMLFQAFSGYATGYFAKLNGWLNGFMVGLVASLFSGFIDIVVNPSLMSQIHLFMPMRVLHAIVICSLGGLCWDLQLKYSKTNSVT